MVECSDGSFYTGWTTDVKRRFFIHQRGKGAKYTRIRRPLKLIYIEELKTKSEALKREIIIKRLKRDKKEELLENLTEKEKGLIRNINDEWENRTKVRKKED